MTQKDLSGKVAVITGGSSGIGRATAVALAERGVKVVIGDISVEEGEAAVQEINAKAGGNVAAFKKTDVTKYQDNIQLFQLAEKEFGGVDIAYLNAGSGRGWDSVFGEMDDETEERVFMINTLGVVKGTKVAMLHMAKRGGGVIINTSSTGGFHSTISAAAYSASKHAVIGWTRGFDDLPKICNVRVNAVCPGYVDTTKFMSSAFRENEVIPPLLTLNPITPTVDVQTVVKAVLTFIEDETLNGIINCSPFSSL
ncbi:3-oxoacyl-reductase [Fennellomyces sp. T-0311]|nr:3-oxoacyl-reductase [Fennellomyces sp. T-0311]